MYNISNIYHPQGLGLVASSRRTIRDGRQYARFFGASNSQTTIVKGDADVNDTVAHALKMIKREAPNVLKLAKYLQRGSLAETCKSLFDFMFNHYQYKIDTPGQEQLRTPARAFKDRVSGIDCDCYSISIGSLLTALKIPFALRIIKMYNKDYYQHIYVVVPKIMGADLNQRSNYWVIDPVLDTFDKEAPFTAKQDFTMQLAELSGVNDENLIGHEFDGFGTTCEGTVHTFNKRMKNHIVNTRNAIVKNPNMVKGFYNPHKFVQVADSVIKHWDNPATREKALAWASDVEMGIVDDDMQGLHGILDGDEYGNEIHDHLGNDIDYLEAISGYDLTGGLGKLKSKAAKMASAKAKIAAPASKANKTKKGFFTKVKNAGKAITKNPKGIAKKLFKLTQKVNPAALAIRAAVLAAMKLNVGHFSAKLKLAYGSQSQAEKAGFNYAHLVKAKNQIEKMFSDVLGGNPSKLKQAIVTHKQIFHKGSKNAEVMDGLGIVVATAAGASVAAASPFLVKIAAVLKSILQNPKVKEKLMQGAKTAANSLMKNNATDEGGSGNESATNEGGGNNEFIPTSATQNSGGDNSSSVVDTTGKNVNDEGEATTSAPKIPKAIVYGGIAATAAVLIGFALSGHKSASKAVGGTAKKSTQVYL